MAEAFAPARNDEAREATSRTVQFFLGMLWRRKWRISLGVMVGLAAGYYFYSQRKPVFSSSAQVMVVKKRPNALPVPGVDAGSADYYDDYLATHMVLLKSPKILEKAVQRPELQPLAGQINQATIRTGLSLSREIDKNSANSTPVGSILNLSYTGPHADECPLILAAVIKTYKEFLDESYTSVSNETVELISKAEGVLLKELKEKTEQYQTFRRNAPPQWKSKAGGTGEQEVGSSVQVRRTAQQQRRAELQGQLNAIDKSRAEGKSSEEIARLVNVASPQPWSQVERVQLLISKKNQLLFKYGPAHPDVRAIQQQIDETRDIPSPRGSSGRTGASEKQAHELLLASALDDKIKLLKAELTSLDAQIQESTKVYEEQLREAQKLANLDIRDEMLRSEMAQTRQLYDTILSRLQQVNLVKDLGGFSAQTISPPGPAGDATPRMLPMLLQPGCVGFLIGLALAYLGELTDKRFRTPADIRNRLGVPVVGHIPLLRRPSPVPLHKVEFQGRTLDAILCNYHRPKSIDAEAYRGVRTALYFSTRGEGPKVIQITSPDQGDGKSTLAANLAISIAQSGKKVLLIDGDFRRPRQQRIFGVSNKAGLASHLAGKGNWTSAVAESGIPALSILPCGPVPQNPAELLLSPRFKAMLDEARNQYDFVIMDTPPLLAVTDPCVVASHADGVLLTLSIAKNSRQQSERAKEILDSLGANVLGVVVNAVDRRANTYAYYQHDSGYGDKYGYNNETETQSFPENDGLRKHLA